MTNNFKPQKSGRGCKEGCNGCNQRNINCGAFQFNSSEILILNPHPTTMILFVAVRD